MAAPHERLLGSVGVAAMSALAIAAVFVPRPGTAPSTSYAGVSTPVHAADLVAGLGLLAAGLVASMESRTRRLGFLAVVAGALWFAPDWEGWDAGPTLVRSLGAAVAPLLVAVLVHLVLAFPSGRMSGRLGRTAIAGFYAGSLVVAIGRTLVRDPFLDIACWRDCLGNSFLVHSDPGLASALGDIWSGLRVAAGAVIAAATVARLAWAGGALRRALVPALLPVLVLGGAEIAYGAQLVTTTIEDPNSAPFEAAFVVRAVGFAGLALAIGWTAAGERRRRASVGRLADELGERPAPGMLASVLAAALNDPHLEVVYRLPDGRHVDAQGAPASGSPGSGRVATPVRRDGRDVGLVVHDAALLDESSLEREIGAAARLAVDNERLQAEVLARLADLRASRARIVEVGDAERRRLERDLHDGAQQSLLALSYDLRVAQAGALRDGDEELAATLAAAVEEAVAALGDLRELAHGIFPAILTEAGLGPALATLADSAPLSVELSARADERYPAGVETAAYVAAVELVADAADRGASHARVEIVHHGSQLAVSVSDDGAERLDPPIEVVDRVGALGGAVEANGTGRRAVIPCA